MFVDISLAAAVGTTETRGDNLNIITGEWSPHVSAFNSWPGATRNDAYGIGTEILAIALRQCGLAAEFRFRPREKGA